MAFFQLDLLKVRLPKAELLIAKAKPYASSILFILFIRGFFLFGYNSAGFNQDQDSEIPAIGRHEFRMTIPFCMAFFQLDLLKARLPKAGLLIAKAKPYASPILLIFFIRGLSLLWLQQSWDCSTLGFCNTCLWQVDVFCGSAGRGESHAWAWP